MGAADSAMTTAQYARALERARALGYLPSPAAQPVSKYAAKAGARSVPSKPPTRGPSHEVWPTEALHIAPTAEGVCLRLVDPAGVVAGRKNPRSRKGASAVLTLHQTRRMIGRLERGTSSELIVGPVHLEQRPIKGDRIIFRDSRRRVAVAFPALAARLRQALE